MFRRGVPSRSAAFHASRRSTRPAVRRAP